MAPVVSASLGTLAPLLGKLTALLADECRRLKGVRREIRSLRSELVSMHGALKKYTMLDDPDEQVKEWISLVRELAYDTEDCFDKFIHHLGTGGNGGGFKEFFRKTVRRLKTLGARHGIANQINDLKVRIREVKELRISYKVDDIASSTSHQAAVDPRLSALFAEEAHLVGIEGPRDDLSKWMVDEGNKHHRRVLSIIGFGGLGKTTLANEIYRKIQGDFHCHAFVSVSQKPDTKRIIKDLVSQVSRKDGEFTKDMESWDETKSIAKLRELLYDKRYLVIIDDIWSISAWNSIKCAFPENKFSSRIIATTRIFEVASSCCPSGDDQIYKMITLSNSHSQKLFFNRVFGPEGHCPDMLKEVSSAILKKCGGLPLAIISISGLLANRPRVKEAWDKVKRSIGSDLNKSQSLEGMKKILSLSYNDLPHNLKTCLLHLCNFPEDYVIERGRLVTRWITEGFISEERGQNLQEVAEKYFYELINRSMVQPVDISCDGKARACRIHDMMLELIISKSIEENFVTVVNGCQTVWENSHCFIRRLSVQHIDHQLASVLASKDLRHVRSLTVTSSSCVKHLPSLDKFESLRVLDFEDCSGLEEYDMNGMENLFQLKYLSFKRTGISELPAGIVNLHDLQMLDLTGTNIQELPTGIVQLTEVHVLLVGNNSSKIKIPVGIGKMKNLQVIFEFDITSSTVSAVEELSNLMNLGILYVGYMVEPEESHKYMRHAEMLVSSLCKLNLRWVSIHGGDSCLFELLDSWSPLPYRLEGFQLRGSFCLSKLPKWIVPALTNLAFLEINLTEVTQDDLHILGELPALLSLEVFFNTVQKGRLLVQGRGFPCLKDFGYNLFQAGAGILLFEEGALPKLERFHLSLVVSMAKAYGFYVGIEHLPCLKDACFTLHNMGATSSQSKAAAASIRKEVSLHPNHPRLILGGEIEESGTDDEVNEKQIIATFPFHFTCWRDSLYK